MRATEPADRRPTGAVTGVTRPRTCWATAGLEVRADHVIDATGVWLGQPEAPLGGSTHAARAQPRHATCCSSAGACPSRSGMTLRIPGRVLFLIPCPGAWLVGTTDEPDDGPPERPAPTATRSTTSSRRSTACSTWTSSAADAVGAYAGLRPARGRARRRHGARQPRAHDPSRGVRAWCASRAASTRPTGSWRATPSTWRSRRCGRAPPQRDRGPAAASARRPRTRARTASPTSWPREPGLNAGRARARSSTGTAREARDVVRARPRARPGAAAGARHPAPGGRGRLGRAPRSWRSVARRRPVPADAPVDGAPRPRRLHRAARGRASWAPSWAGTRPARAAEVADYLAGARREYDVPGAGARPARARRPDGWTG